MNQLKEQEPKKDDFRYADDNLWEVIGLPNERLKTPGLPGRRSNQLNYDPDRVQSES